MKTLFKIAILALLMWGAYSYGYRNCENDYKLSVKQATEDVSKVTDIIMNGVENAMPSDSNNAATDAKNETP